MADSVEWGRGERVEDKERVVSQNGEKGWELSYFITFYRGDTKRNTTTHNKTPFH